MAGSAGTRMVSSSLSSPFSDVETSGSCAAAAAFESVSERVNVALRSPDFRRRYVFCAKTEIPTFL